MSETVCEVSWAPAADAADAAQRATDRHYATQRLVAWLRAPDWAFWYWLCGMGVALAIFRLLIPTP